MGLLGLLEENTQRQLLSFRGCLAVLEVEEGLSGLVAVIVAAVVLVVVVLVVLVAVLAAPEWN